MDKSVKPGDNFFLYVNGNWLKTAAIPPDRSQTGSFQDLQILSETAACAPSSTIWRRSPTPQLTAGREEAARSL